MSTSPFASRRVATWIGLALSLLGIYTIVQVLRFLTGAVHSDLQLLCRESAIFAMVGLLLWIATAWEKLPLSSIGIRREKLGASVLWGIALAAIVLAVTVGLYFLLQTLGLPLGGGESGGYKPSAALTTLIVLRAGIAEEICFRGYAIERLKSLTGSTWLAALLPLVVFSALHYSQGIGGQIAAFILGAIFTVFYLRRRDLVANIVAHFLADFVLNVVLR